MDLDNAQVTITPPTNCLSSLNVTGQLTANNLSSTSLQVALNGKVDNLQVLTDVPSGAVFTDTVYSHPATHSIGEVNGLQTALNGKVDDSQVLTDVPSGAVFTDTVYSHPATHSIGEVNGLQTPSTTRA
jgi:hypothetical protein